VSERQDMGDCRSGTVATRQSPSRVSPFRPFGRVSTIAARLARAWRRCNRSPYVADLRVIQVQHRQLYRSRMERGDCGSALNALYNAHLNGHLRSQRRSA
jgi:hypothetical protein